MADEQATAPTAEPVAAWAERLLAKAEDIVRRLEIALHGDHETICNKYLAERINQLEDKLERTSIACTDHAVLIGELKEALHAVNERLDRAAVAIKPLLGMAADFSAVEQRLDALEKQGTNK